MKKNKFKLEAVLKIRKLKEDLCKIELGKLQKRMTELTGYKKGHLDDIQEAYSNQEQTLKKSTNLLEVTKISSLIQGKRDHIARIEDEMLSLKEDISSKVTELAKLRGDVKVISNMKEKSEKEFKQELNKKRFQNLEEQTQNWNTIKDII